MGETKHVSTTKGGPEGVRSPGPWGTERTRKMPKGKHENIQIDTQMTPNGPNMDLKMAKN